MKKTYWTSCGDVKQVTFDEFLELLSVEEMESESAEFEMQTDYEMHNISHKRQPVVLGRDSAEFLKDQFLTQIENFSSNKSLVRFADELSDDSVEAAAVECLCDFGMPDHLVKLDESTYVLCGLKYNDALGVKSYQGKVGLVVYKPRTCRVIKIQKESK